MKKANVSRSTTLIAVAFAFLAGFLVGLIFSILPKGHEATIYWNHDALEQFALTESSNETPDTLIKYKNTPSEFHSAGLKYYWSKNGFVFFVLSNNGFGFDDPEEVIFF